MNSARVALAVTGGYVLGRMHKGRWALALAGFAAGRKLRTGGGLASGLLGSPELERLTGQVRGDLASAGRKAAVSTLGSGIDALSDRMRERASVLRAPSREQREGEEDEGEERAGEQAEREKPRAEKPHAEKPQAEKPQAEKPQAEKREPGQDEGREHERRAGRKAVRERKHQGRPERRTAAAGKHTARGRG